MISLYQLTQDWNTLLEQMDNLPEDAFWDTLEALEGEFDQKAENISCLIKSLRMEAQCIGDECKALKERADAKEKQADRLKSYLEEQLKAVGKRKLETPRCVVTIAKSPERVVLDDGFLEWAQSHADNLVNYGKPEPNKTAIKEAIKSGQEVPYARLESGETLRIK